MRIAQLVTRRQRRGAEVFAADLSAQLAQRGHVVHYAGLGDPPDQPLAPAGTQCDDISAASSSLLSFRLIRDLGRYLKSIQPDIIQANGGFAMKYAVLAKRWTRGQWPIVYCNIGLSSDWLRRPGQKLWNRWLIRQTDFVAAVSEASRVDLMRTYGLDSKNVAVIRRGVAFPSLDAEESRVSLRKEIGAAADSAVLLHVGSFTPEKNHVGLLKIFAAVRQSMDVQPHLVLVGDGPQREEIAKLAGSDSHIHLLGLCDDVSRLMAAADLLLLPSLTEGIPGVILEAGAQSLPTVAYDVGGVGEVMRNGETGMIVPSGVESDFAEQVTKLISDPVTRVSIGENCKRFVQRHYSLDRSVDEFEGVYERIASVHSSEPIHTHA